MATKIEIIGGALVCTDTVSGLILISQPSKDIWYKEDDLQNIERISFYDANCINGAGIYSSELPTIQISDAVDSTLNPFTVITFREFATNFLGYDKIAQTTESLITGWGSYNDTQYTIGSPFTLTADTDTALPNNAGNVIETQKPIDITTFYDGTVITGRSGDNLDAQIYFKAVPTVVNQWLDIWVDITGGTGTPVNLAFLYRDTKAFPRGSGVERGILYALPSGYTLDTWAANGGVVKVRSNAAVDIYDIVFNFDRSHKAR